MTDTELLAALVTSILFADPVGSCTGDVTGDRAVDGRDLSVVLHNYGKEPARWVEGDVNDDGKVDGGDLIVVLNTFGCDEFNERK